MYGRIYNFSPGPAVLPVEALEAVRDNLLNYNGSGIGVMELSHRSSDFEGIIAEAEANVRTLLGVDESYAVLFLQGGATTQFAMVPMNLLGAGKVANYLLSGYWAERALEEAKKFGETAIAGTSKEDNYCKLPTDVKLSKNPAYLHFTSNNTIYGTQFKREPEVGSEVLVCDASSDLFSRAIPVKKYGLIYAGAQKNFGPAGVTLVIIRRDLLERSPKNLATYLDYNTHAKGKSLYNTAPTFPIYVVSEVLRWLKRSGGIKAIEAANEKKAAQLYDVLDSSDFYTPFAEKNSRSLMNVVFRLKDTSLEDRFIKEAEDAGFSGLKGHRNIGGCRASIYNALPAQGVEALCGFMGEFARKNG